jgi:hypothetical protein
VNEAAATAVVDDVAEALSGRLGDRQPGPAGSPPQGSAAAPVPIPTTVRIRIALNQRRLIFPGPLYSVERRHAISGCSHSCTATTF